MTRRRSGYVACALAAGLLCACSSDEGGSRIGQPVAGQTGGAPNNLPPASGAGGAAADSGSGTGTDAGLGDGALPPPPPEMMLGSCGDSIEGLGNCGAQTVGARIRRPNMLIVMDKSSSMTDQPEGFEQPIWQGVKAALATALDSVKSSVWFGLELFPVSADRSNPIRERCEDRCCEMPGDAVMDVPIQEGSVSVPQIVAALDAVEPGGGTPVGVALKRAYEYFTIGDGAQLDGEKFVLLATDGGPNCNAALSCEADKCTTNLEGVCTRPGQNCCADLPISCVDDDEVISQIRALRRAGVFTFVVGIPGSEAYANYLDSFAIAGDRPNPNGPPAYYRVDAAAGVEGLTAVFKDITTQLVTSCDLELQDEPPDPEQVNVALECEVIPKDGTDGTDGWVLDMESTPQKISLQGTLCRWVQEKGAERVDIIFGCPTVVVR